MTASKLLWWNGPSVYNPKDATFDFPIYLSLADKIGIIGLVVWDKDLFKKEYLGKVSVPLDDQFIDKRDNGYSNQGMRVGFDLFPVVDPIVSWSS